MFSVNFRHKGQVSRYFIFYLMFVLKEICIPIQRHICMKWKKRWTNPLPAFCQDSRLFRKKMFHPCLNSLNNLKGTSKLWYNHSWLRQKNSAGNIIFNLINFTSTIKLPQRRVCRFHNNQVVLAAKCFSRLNRKN